MGCPEHGKTAGALDCIFHSFTNIILFNSIQNESNPYQTDTFYIDEKNIKKNKKKTTQCMREHFQISDRFFYIIERNCYL